MAGGPILGSVLLDWDRANGGTIGISLLSGMVVILVEWCWAVANKFKLGNDRTKSKVGMPRCRSTSNLLL